MAKHFKNYFGDKIHSSKGEISANFGIKSEFGLNKCID